MSGPEAADTEAAGLEPAGGQFLADVLAGLSRPQKAVPAKYFYDARGSALFEEITALPEYYPTRTELGILSAHAAEIGERIGPGAAVIEFGAGASRKIRLLLDALTEPAAFIPVDISGEQVTEAARVLAADYPRLRVLPVVGDYTRRLDLPIDGGLARAKRVVFFPGSTIGNFTPDEARAFLARACDLLQGGEMIVGVDLKKDPALLHAAYNDDRGVTAAFNLNLLDRMNRDLGADFDRDRFRHYAFYNIPLSRIEMHLVSAADQTARIAGHVFRFADGESIHTENSYKFTVAEFRALAAEAGFAAVTAWTDPAGLFGLHYLRAR